MSMRSIVALILAVAIVAFPAGDVRADCSSPRISFAPEAVGPGETLTITGEGFWDKCIDSFPTQEVARPFEGIELTLVQGDSSWVVARGSADENAEFIIDVVVPLDAQAGDARLTASVGQSLRIPSARTLTISANPAPNTNEPDIAAFGPNQDTTTTSAAATPTTNPESALDDRPTATSAAEEDGPSPLVITAVIAGGAAAVALGTWTARRRARST